ncbi:MAG: hypothetical protein V5A68_02155 [Candidatus Thermoplasmatota archaeon]
MIFLIISIQVQAITENNFIQKKDPIENSFEIKLPDDIYEWKDGDITGEWKYKQENTQGDLKAYIKQGRKPDVGLIIGRWNTTNKKTNGLFKSILIKDKTIGIIQNKKQQNIIPFFGNIKKNNQTNFQLTLNLPINKKITINGKYFTSFLPNLTGQYKVGIKRYHIIDNNRSEKFTPEKPEDKRKLKIQIWYPTEKQNPTIDYMDYQTFQWLKSRSPIPLFTIPNQAYKYIKTHTVNQAPVSTDQKNYPLILFSPGYDGNPEIYTSLIEDVVSHGFIVLSINHPYISGMTIFPDGEIIKAHPIMNISLPTLIKDVQFVLNYTEILNQTHPLLKGKIDLSRIGMYGHSFGGAATLISCYQDPRIKAGLTLDGVIYKDKIKDDINKPFMIMLAENSFMETLADQLWNNLSQRAYKISIRGSTHYAFTDVGILLNHFLPIIPPKILGFGTIKPKRMINITKSYKIAFFNAYLKNNPEENIDQYSNIFDEVIYDKKT